MSEKLAKKAIITQLTVSNTVSQVITTLQPDLGVQIKALKTNSGIIYIGHANVASGNSYQLDAGESLFIPVDNLKDLFILASINNDKLSVMVL